MADTEPAVEPADTSPDADSVMESEDGTSSSSSASRSSSMGSSSSGGRSSRMGKKKETKKKHEIEPPIRGLTHTETRQLSKWKKTELYRNEQYLRAHPEISNMIKGFVCRVLEEKPQDVVAFAVEHFVADKHLPSNRYQVKTTETFEEGNDGGEE